MRFTLATKEATMNTKTQTKPSVTKEPGKTDKVADSSGAVHVEPESANEGAAPNPHPAYHINGQPVSKEEYERSTR
jgi:hypothetical protein